ncbi:hypothetical protein IKF76_00345 [Candidatus Saccharibacteria bacterium]|nr:hypothetical protein [Candidatus Saccharibacteria bacterium]
MNIAEFAYGVERMVDPMDVGTTHHMQKKLRRLPVWLQRKIVTNATKKATKMGFVVEPYCFLLFHEITDPTAVQPWLPEGFEPAKASIFAGDKPKFYSVTTIFRVHTSAFWGSRCEFYAMARNSATGLLSWVILDYVSDTISYDEQAGLRSPEAPNAVVTTTCEGEYLASFKRQSDGCVLTCEADLKRHKMRALDEEFWIDGNTSIAYSKPLGGDDGDLFSLTFFPEEMKQAWEIPITDITKHEITFLPEFFSGPLDKAVCFPFAQHMLSDSPGTRTHYGSKAALLKAAKSADFSKLKNFMGK